MAAQEPADAPRRLRELSEDVRAALLLDERGEPVASSEQDPGKAGELADAARRLMREVDGAADGRAVSELEAHPARGSAYAVRTRGFTLVAVARRSALPALVRYDMRSVLAELLGERPLHVAERPTGASQ